MTHPHTFAPRLSAYAAKAQARAHQTWNPETLEAQYQKELAIAAEFESEQGHGNKLVSWKVNFKAGQTVTLGADRFRIVALTRRGLVLHHINQKL